MIAKTINAETAKAAEKNKTATRGKLCVLCALCV
jgi:hypothetical protein